MKIIGDQAIFSTGKEIYANGGTIGIDPDGAVTQGYDGGFDNNDLTPAEAAELADYMIGLWTEFKERRK